MKKKPPVMSREEFTTRTFRGWSDAFDIPPGRFSEPGTDVRPREKTGKDLAVHLWHIGERVVAQLDPVLVRELEAWVKKSPGVPLDVDAVKAVYGEARVFRSDRSKIWYLHPEDHARVEPPDGVTVRKLGPDDTYAMKDLNAACTDEEAEEAYVELNHLIAQGAFEGERLLAASSGYVRTGFLDLGVVTHPEARKRGLGRLVVSVLCDWANEQGHLPQYRHDIGNLASRALPSALGFTETFAQESVWLRPDAA